MRAITVYDRVLRILPSLYALGIENRATAAVIIANMLAARHQSRTRNSFLLDLLVS